MARLWLFLAAALACAATTPLRASAGAAAANPSVADAVDLQRAYALFALLRGQDDLVFEHPLDGCYARCHLMTLKLTQMEAPVKRVWAFANGSRLHAKTARAGAVEWDWHVAPLVAVFQGTQVEWLVFDPTVYDRPVTIEKWAAGMRKAETSPWPQITTTYLGEAPFRNGKRVGGTGYWNGADPREGPTVHAMATLKGYKSTLSAKAAAAASPKKAIAPQDGKAITRPPATVSAAAVHPDVPTVVGRPTNRTPAHRD